jgi:hypothetical protein
MPENKIMLVDENKQILIILKNINVSELLKSKVFNIKN